MKIYEINAEIEAMLNSLIPDPETGEVADVESLAARLEELNGEKSRKLEACAKAYFDATSAASMLKAEKERLSKKQAAMERKAEKILNFLAFVSDGEKMNCGIATLSFPSPRPSAEVTDAAAAADWLDKNGYPDFYTKQAPKLVLNDVKPLLLNGVDIPGVHLEYKQKAVLK